MSALFGLRGAVQAEADTPEAIDAATLALLDAMVERNGIDSGSIAAAWFTQTPDLRSVYPAASARNMGWNAVPMMCAQEAVVEGALPRTIRALLLVDGLEGREVRHVYLGATRALRPDLDHHSEGGSQS